MFAPLPDSMTLKVYVHDVSVPTPYVINKMRTPSKVEQDEVAPSTTLLDGFCVVLASITMDGLTLTHDVIVTSIVL
jgi:hypothetical protein